MQVVIDIEKGEYEHIKNGCFDYWSAEAIHKAVANGTPLPEGHDRLVEARAVIKALFGHQTIDDVPTIVEEDKGQK